MTSLWARAKPSRYESAFLAALLTYVLVASTLLLVPLPSLATSATPVAGPSAPLNPSNTSPPLEPTGELRPIPKVISVPSGGHLLDNCGIASACVTPGVSLAAYGGLVIVVANYGGTAFPSTVTNSKGGTATVAQASFSSPSASLYSAYFSNLTATAATGVTVSVSFASSTLFSVAVYSVQRTAIPVQFVVNPACGSTTFCFGSGSSSPATIAENGGGVGEFDSFVGLAFMSGASFSTETAVNGVLVNNTPLGSGYWESVVTNNSLSALPTSLGSTFSPAPSVSIAWVGVQLALVPAARPAAPTGLAATPAATSVALTWNPVSGPNVNYTVAQAQFHTPCGAYTTFYSVGTHNSYTVTGLPSGYDLCFRVTVWNTTSQSMPSTAVTNVQGPAGPQSNYYAAVSVTTALSWVNQTINLWSANVTVSGSGVLTIDNSTVNFINNETGGKHTLLPLNNWLRETAGTLVIKESNIGAVNGSAYPSSIYISGGTTKVFYDEFHTLGMVNFTSNENGILVKTASVAFTNDIFDDVYTVEFQTSTAQHDSVANSVVTDAHFNSLPYASTQGLIHVNSAAGNFSLTNTTVDGTAANEIDVYATANHYVAWGDTILGNTSSTSTYYGMTFKGSGSDHVTPLLVAFCDVQGASIEVDVHSETAGLNTTGITLINNTVNNTGLVGSGGSSQGNNGLYVTDTTGGTGTAGDIMANVIIRGNLITNFTGDGIRLSNNVTVFNISKNTIFNYDGNGVPVSNITEFIYLIRDVNHGSVWANRLDGWPSVHPSSGTNGINVESNCHYITVSNNTLTNFTQVGFTAQGDYGTDGEPHWDIGQNGHVVFKGNSFINYRTLVGINQSKEHQSGINVWISNGTQVLNNYFRYDGTTTDQPYNGACIHDSSTYTLLKGNALVNCAYGVVFYVVATSFESETIGYFNQSWNLVINNTITNASTKSIVSDASKLTDGSTNFVEGLTSPSWTYSMVTSHDHLRFVNTTTSSYSSTTGFYSTDNLWNYGPVLLTSRTTAFEVEGSDWNATPKFSYSTLTTTVLSAPNSNFFFNGTITTLSPDYVNVTAQEGVTTASVWFNMTTLVPFAYYTVYAGGVNISHFIASGGGTGQFLLTWSATGTQSLVITDIAGGGGGQHGNGSGGGGGSNPFGGLSTTTLEDLGLALLAAVIVGLIVEVYARSRRESGA